MSNPTKAAEIAPVTDSFILGRPGSVLNDLPFDFKWEFTRRHPYYLSFWQLARMRPENKTGPEFLMSDAARFILGLIGVTSEYISPATAVDELGVTGLETQWHGGAVSPVIVRNLVASLAVTLPKETLQEIAKLLSRAAGIDKQDTAEWYPFIREITQGDHAGFDLMLPDLMVLINPQASQRAISTAIEELVRQLKTQHNIPEHRRRDEKLDEYVAVWDAREGWTGSEYDRSKEKSLKDIGQKLRISTSTAWNRYCSAFRYIIGHDYQTDRWWKVMGLLKVSLPPGGLEISTRRPINPRRTRDVPVAALGKETMPGLEQRQYLKVAGVEAARIELIDVMIDIDDLLQRGKSSAEILAELELTDAAIDLIDLARERRQGAT